MDRNEAVLRELNLYPLWKRRDAPAQSGALETAGAIDKTTAIRLSYQKAIAKPPVIRNRPNKAAQRQMSEQYTNRMNKQVRRQQKCG